ncbi:MAG: YiiD C-terminal domain-containing protein [Wenzhouxiangella sp.]
MTDEKTWLQATLSDKIPMARAMGVQIQRLDDAGLCIDLPLAPNINDKGTVFGGAMTSAMILAGWSLPHLLLRRAGVSADLVIGRCEVRFLAPVDGPFQALCAWPEETACQAFLADVQSGQRGRLALQPRILHNSEDCAILEARYTALPSKA